MILTAVTHFFDAIEAGKSILDASAQKCTQEVLAGLATCQPGLDKIR